MDNIDKLKETLNNADYILVGAGSGLSTSAGFYYSGERFERYYSDYIKKYGFKDLYTASFYPFKTEEEFWAFFSRLTYYERYDKIPRPAVFKDLLDILKDKDYFIITTNVDHTFQRSGFDKNRLFYTQGDYGLWQCAKPCHNKTYDNKDQVLEMVKTQKDLKIPSSLIPKCPVCGGPMTTNLRKDDVFVEDEGWHNAQRRYHEWLDARKNGNIVFLDLGTGYNTPGIFKYPFWHMTYDNPRATYITINYDDARVPEEIKNQSLAFEDDIGRVLKEVNSR